MTLISRSIAAAAAAFFMGAVGAQATPISYTITLTQQLGNTGGGSGAFSIDGDDLSGIGNEFFTYGNPSETLLSLSFSIDGQTFDLADSLGGDQVFFQNGNVAGITYLGVDSSVSIVLTAGALSYTYAGSNQRFSQGTLAATPTSVPEPAPVALLAVGLLGLGLALRRKSA